MSGSKGGGEAGYVLSNHGLARSPLCSILLHAPAKSCLVALLPNSVSKRASFGCQRCANSVVVSLGAHFQGRNDDGELQCSSFGTRANTNVMDAWHYGALMITLVAMEDECIIQWSGLKGVQHRERRTFPTSSSQFDTGSCARFPHRAGEWNEWTIDPFRPRPNPSIMSLPAGASAIANAAKKFTHVFTNFEQPAKNAERDF